jgi:hypothetical protein
MFHPVGTPGVRLTTCSCVVKKLVVAGCGLSCFYNGEGLTMNCCKPPDAVCCGQLTVALNQKVLRLSSALF